MNKLKLVIGLGSSRREELALAFCRRRGCE
jgi:hypothetical protein